MTVRCDLHAIDRELKVEVRVCGTKPPRQPFSPFVVVELRVENGYVTLFLSPDQALDLAHGIRSALQAADQDGETAAEALPEREGA